MKNILFFLIFTLLPAGSIGKNPVRIGIDGLSHSHVHGLLNAMSSRPELQIVGIAESDKDMAQRYAERYGFSMDIVFPTVEEMVEKTKPEGVMAFNSIYGHLRTVEACAPHGIHVMVEKPLAVSTAHSGKMAELARKHNILLLTNYETTWYATNQKAYDMVRRREIGDIRKVIICDGHQGPVEIGCNPEFLAWLTDPKLNGGGAVIDFGCYGANLMTWLMQNERPVTVSATLQQIKPDVYPKVDDEATVVLTYPRSQAIIQASWNWPFSRKDMEIYGISGYIKAINPNDIAYRLPKERTETNERLPSLSAPGDDPFRYFIAAIRGDIVVKPSDLSSLENNLIVVEILEAARKSAASGKTVKLKNGK
jgi:predicted dehydrogenase